MQISSKEFRSIANDVDDMHRDSMRTFREEIEELHFGQEFAAGRRDFLKKAAIGGAALTFGSALVPVSSLLPGAGAQALDDVAIGTFAVSVELAAVEAYKAGAPLLSEATLPVAQMFLGHHQEHAGAFASIVGTTPEEVGPNQALLAALKPTIDGLTDEAGVLAFAQAVENQAVATYAFALTALTLEAAYTGTATILPVESAHAATLAFARGAIEELFPFGAFESSDISKGIDPSVYPVA